jgi:hypothetical protein
MSQEPRTATTFDLDGLTGTLTAAFATDPLWSSAFPDPEDLAVWWRFCIGSALRYPWVWIRGDYGAASASNLEWMDAEGVPAFLESSNPGNNSRYERLGFRQVGEFTTPDGARTVATMWREVGGSQN